MRRVSDQPITLKNQHNKSTLAEEIQIRVGVNSGIEWELSGIPDSIPGIGLGIGIEKKGIGIELELTKNARN